MSDLSVSRENNIITIAFNRLEKKNAITIAMYDEMATTLADAEQDTTVRAIIFHGLEGCFSAGNDLQDFLAAGTTEFNEDIPVMQFLKKLISSTVPVIAAVDGMAIGIGTTLLLHCDHVVCSKKSLLKMPFVDLALVPEAASSYVLPKIMGYTRAADMLLAGRALNGQEAFDWGIATHVVDDFQAGIEQAQSLANDYHNRPPAAVRKSKKLLKGDLDRTLEVLKIEAVEFGNQLKSPECHEAIMAFMERRKPDWTKFG